MVSDEEMRKLARPTWVLEKFSGSKQGNHYFRIKRTLADGEEVLSDTNRLQMPASTPLHRERLFNYAEIRSPTNRVC